MAARGFEAADEFARIVASLGEPTMTADAPAGELTRAALAIARVLGGELDESRTDVALARLAARCPEPTREGVADGLVRSGALRGDPEYADGWKMSCLDHVLATGTGLPITLSIVVIEVARRLGVPLHGVGMPTHFLVGDERDDDWFLDPFHGRQLDRAGCRALLGQLTGGRLAWQDSFLLPTPSIDVVVRMLNNLRATFAAGRDPVRLALVMRMRLAVPGLDGEDGEARRALAVLN